MLGTDIYPSERLILLLSTFHIFSEIVNWELDYSDNVNWNVPSVIVFYSSVFKKSNRKF